jgi:hypothetical protein
VARVCGGDDEHQRVGAILVIARNVSGGGGNEHQRVEAILVIARNVSDDGNVGDDGDVGRGEAVPRIDQRTFSMMATASPLRHSSRSWRRNGASPPVFIAGTAPWRQKFGSRFSVLGSRFSVLGSRFSVLVGSIIPGGTGAPSPVRRRRGG